MLRLLLAGLILAGIIVAGCYKRPGAGKVKIVVSTTAPTTGPSTRPALAASGGTTQPSEPARPSASFLVVAGEAVTFPPARVRVEHEQPVVLRLFSDDPSAALSLKYEGNRYFFLFHLNIADPAQLAANQAIQIHVQAPSDIRRDEPDGVFLQGDRKQLQAQNATFQLIRHGGDLMVLIDGTFLVFQKDDIGAPGVVRIHGTLSAEIENWSPKRPHRP